MCSSDLPEGSEPGRAESAGLWQPGPGAAESLCSGLGAVTGGSGKRSGSAGLSGALPSPWFLLEDLGGGTQRGSRGVTRQAGTTSDTLTNAA